MISTNIVEITDSLFTQAEVRLITSCEGNNPGGSIKDHMVYNVLAEKLQRGELQSGSSVSEVSSGSTALSLAYYCRHFDLRCHLFVPTTISENILRKINDLKANVHTVSAETAYTAHEEFLIQHPQCFYFNQLFDSTKQVHYHKLGEKFKKEIGHFDLIIGAVGTGHSLKGVSSAIEAERLFSAEPIAQENCPGVRNLDVTRFGLQDSCRPENFDERILIAQKNFFVSNKIHTNKGTLSISESFRLVLGAVQEILPTVKKKTILALGAQNQISE